MARPMARQRVYTKYKPEKPKAKPPRRFGWLLLLLGVAVMGNLVWAVRIGRVTLPAKVQKWVRREPAPMEPEKRPAAPAPVLPAPLNTRPVTVPKPIPPSPARETNGVIAPRPPVPPVEDPAFVARSAVNLFEVQLALARQAISPGILDGLSGPQTTLAIRAFQQMVGLEPTGQPDAATKARLVLTAPVFTTYVVTSNDLARVRPLAAGWLGKSRQAALEYESVLELVAEKAHAYPRYLQSLNPEVDWKQLSAGTTLKVPRIAYPRVTEKAAFLRIRLGEKTLQAFTARTNLLAHFPCSIAKKAEKRPLGELTVITVAADPNYTFNPENFPGTPEARELDSKLTLPPGPNNPVGTAWIGLSLPGFGIHGTPNPEKIGRTESLGCFRLANWDANHLLQLVQTGTPVLVEP